MTFSFSILFLFRLAELGLEAGVVASLGDVGRRVRFVDLRVPSEMSIFFVVAEKL
jgi:hypothetical protein